MGRGETYEFRLCSLAEKILKEFFYWFQLRRLIDYEFQRCCNIHLHMMQVFAERKIKI